MIRALYSAASGMRSQEMNVDNIANNLANANTAGYKTRRAQFQDLMYQSVLQPGTAAGQQTVVPAGLQLGLGSRPTSNEIVFTQGSFSETDNPLDMVIQGNGFFQITLPSGELAYTRAGSFQVSAQGQIVNADGYALQPAIAIPNNATSITIGTDGTVSVALPGQQQAQLVGQIQLATFANPGGLNSTGQNLFLPTTASGDAILGTAGGSEGLGTIQQGQLEQSNVNVVEEFVEMILAQRSYESNSKVVQAADQMFQDVNSMSR